MGEDSKSCCKTLQHGLVKAAQGFPLQDGKQDAVSFQVASLLYVTVSSSFRGGFLRKYCTSWGCRAFGPRSECGSLERCSRTLPDASVHTMWFD